MIADPIYLRELERSDLPQLNRWRNDPELLDHLGNNFLFISGAVDEAWFENYLKSRDSAVRLAIIERETNRYIGNTSLTSIHPINRSAEYSIMLGDISCRSKGYGVLVTRMMLRHAFKDRGLNRVHSSLLTENKPSIRMCEKAGFKQEGVCRQALFKNGRFHDMLMMAALAEDFKDS